LLRRTFSHYTNTERRKLGEKVKAGEDSSGGASIFADAAFDLERAAKGIPVVMQLLGFAAPAVGGGNSLNEGGDVANDKSGNNL
jgi:hypothetical protein